MSKTTVLYITYTERNKQVEVPLSSYKCQLYLIKYTRKANF